MITTITIDTDSGLPLVNIKKQEGKTTYAEQTSTLADVYKVLKDMYEVKDDKFEFSSPILPNGTIKYEAHSNDGNYYSIWIEVPKTRWDIRFYERELRDVGFPRLLFRYTVRHKRIVNVVTFAIKDGATIKEGMQFYHFPYSNVSKGGGVCTGNIVFPEIKDTKILESVHVYFFGSSFTHDLAGEYATEGKVGERFAMFTGKDFNDEFLVPAKLWK